MSILIGTSGWQYDSWRGRFYPKDVPKARWLEYFSERFPTVEVNNTFYRLPSDAAFSGWRDRSARGFVVTVKASRYITHIRRLRDAKDPLDLFLSRATDLREKLGPVLFQLPPSLRVDVPLLRDFLTLMPKGIRPAFEFRERSWENDETYAALDGAGAAFVLADGPAVRVPDVVTGGWSYVRFHRGQPGAADYRREKLRRWAGRVAALPASDVFVYFNNDPGGAAVRDARAFTGLLEREGVASVRGPR